MKPIILQKLDLKAPLDSPALTGTPTAPTADAGTNTTQVATTAFVKTAVDNKNTITGNAGTATKLATARTISLSGGVSGSASFDGSANITLAATVADDSHAHTISNVDGLQTALDAKASLASPAFTGTPTAPTATAGTNSTQLATTAFVTNAIGNVLGASDAMVFKGTLGTGGTVTALPATGYSAGWTYKVITAGTYAGQTCEVGDIVVCVKDYATAANSDWTVVQANIDGAVTGPTSSVDLHVAVFNGAGGNVIKDSGFTLGKTVPADAKFTDTVYAHPNSGVTAGTYKSVTVDVQGHVTAGTNPTTLAGYGITDAASTASPALTGTPTAPTATAGTNTTQLATTEFVTTAVANKISVSGNAGTATKLATARTISTNLASSTAASFDGSANVTAGVTGILPVANGGTGNATGLAASATKLATARTITADLGTTTAGSFDGSANVTVGVSGVLPVANGGTGNTTGVVQKAFGDEYGDEISTTYATRHEAGLDAVSWTTTQVTPSGTVLTVPYYTMGGGSVLFYDGLLLTAGNEYTETSTTSVTITWDAEPGNWVAYARPAITPI